MPDCAPFSRDFTCRECGDSEWTMQVSHYGARCWYQCEHCGAEGEVVRDRPRAFRAEMKPTGRHGAIADT